jgi:ferredoxin
MSLYRIEVDQSLCSGFGACADIAPNLIAVDSSGTAQLRVGETDDELALEMAHACPMGAIAVYEITTGRQAA